MSSAFAASLKQGGGTTTKHLRLDGIEPDNLLAFLALLGLLRSLETARPAWRPRAAWDVDAAPLRPVLVLAEPQDELAVCEAAAEGATTLASYHDFPRSTQDTRPQADLKYDAGTARGLLDRAARSPDRRCTDLWSALVSDAAVARSGNVETTPLCLLFGQGHQHFLDRMTMVARTAAPPPRGRGKNAVMLTAAETLREALFQPWERQDPTPGFRWDPAEDARYALRADDPSGEKATTQHGANRLAAVGFPALTAVPVHRGERVGLRVPGGEFAERGEFAFLWPIWRESTSLAGVRALLGHPDLVKGPARLAHLGVTEVRRARRVSNGRFMNFTRAEAFAPTATRALT